MQVLALHTSASFYQFQVLVLLLVGSFLIYSCESEEIVDNKLIGKWNIIKAARGNRITETLEDGFFDFTSDTTFFTNIFNAEEVYDYALTEEGFEQLSPEQQSYEVIYGGSDTIQISATIRKYDFQFLAIRDTVKTISVEL